MNPPYNILDPPLHQVKFQLNCAYCACLNLNHTWVGQKVQLFLIINISCLCLYVGKLIKTFANSGWYF